MPSKSSYRVIILFFSFLLITQLAVVAQHSPYLNKKVTFAFSDTPLSSVLRTIGSSMGIKFSYNPEQIKSSRRITMTFRNKPLGEVLKQLISDPTISIREIGNQIVIFRGDPSQLPLGPDQQIVQGKPQLITPSKKDPDTVYLYQLDTLIINRTDTIFRTITMRDIDTIRIVDTVYIDKTKSAQKSGKTLKDVYSKNSMKYKKFLEDNGFYTGIYYELLPGSATYKNTNQGNDDYFVNMQNADAGSVIKYSTGILAGYDYLKFGVRTGIGYMNIGEIFSYSHASESGGFYKTDTVEKYYTLSGADTSWFYVTDSSWVPKEIRNYSYYNPNAYKYIDIPLAIKFRFWQTETYEIYAIGGINASFLISVDALHINPAGSKTEVVTTTKSNLNPILLAWNAGLGAAFKFSSRTGMIAELVYRSQINNQYKDIPVEKRYHLIGIKAGAYIKF